jgi:putative flippase GtrA
VNSSNLKILVLFLTRFGAVGLAVSVVYSALVVFLVESPIDISPVLASVIAFAVVVPISYLGHRRFSFRLEHDDWNQRLRFVLNVSLSFLLAAGGMHLIVNGLGWSYFFGIAWTWLIVPLINLILNIVLVFRTR